MTGQVESRYTPTSDGKMKFSAGGTLGAMLKKAAKEATADEQQQLEL
jgi:hypothetical protein